MAGVIGRIGVFVCMDGGTGFHRFGAAAETTAVAAEPDSRLQQRAEYVTGSQ